MEIHGSAQYLYEVTPDDLIVLFKPINYLTRIQERAAKYSIKRLTSQ